jgi:hypothetical protein
VVTVAAATAGDEIVDHLSVAVGRLFVVHRPPTGMSRLTAFAAPG